VAGFFQTDGQSGQILSDSVSIGPVGVVHVGHLGGF